MLCVKVWLTLVAFTTNEPSTTLRNFTFWEPTKQPCVMDDLEDDAHTHLCQFSRSSMCLDSTRRLLLNLQFFWKIKWTAVEMRFVAGCTQRRNLWDDWLTTQLRTGSRLRRRHEGRSQMHRLDKNLDQREKFELEKLLNSAINRFFCFLQFLVHFYADGRPTGSRWNWRSLSPGWEEKCTSFGTPAQKQWCGKTGNQCRWNSCEQDANGFLHKICILVDVGESQNNVIQEYIVFALAGVERRKEEDIIHADQEGNEEWLEVSEHGHRNVRCKQDVRICLWMGVCVHICMVNLFFQAKFLRGNGL